MSAQTRRLSGEAPSSPGRGNPEAALLRYDYCNSSVRAVTCCARAGYGFGFSAPLPTGRRAKQSSYAWVVRPRPRGTARRKDPSIIMSAYTLSLLRLQCLCPQERDGDEPYLTLDHERLWHTPRGWHMHAHAEHESHFTQVDFASGRIHTASGWVALPGAVDSGLRRNGLSGLHTLHLFEADTLSRDDALGVTPVRPEDAGRGEIQVLFRRSGAEYVLVYQVDPEASA